MEIERQAECSLETYDEYATWMASFSAKASDALESWLAHEREDGNDLGDGVYLCDGIYM